MLLKLLELEIETTVIFAEFCLEGVFHKQYGIRDV